MKQPQFIPPWLAHRRAVYAEDLRARDAGFERTRLDALRKLGAEAVGRSIADFIVARAAGNDACTLDNLLSAGFTAAEIARYREAAVSRAARQAPDLRG